MAQLNNKNLFTLITSATLLLGLSACGMNNDQRTPENAVMKAKCKNGFDLNEIQKQRLMKFENIDNAVFRTIIVKDPVSTNGLRRAEGMIYRQKTAKEMTTAEELMSLDKDCSTLKANYIGVGAPQGLHSSIKDITKTSITLANDSAQIITIELVQAEENDYAAKAKEQQGMNAVRIKISEIGAKDNEFEAIQMIEMREQGSEVDTALSTVATVQEILGDETSQELNMAMAMASSLGQSSSIKVNSKVLADAIDQAVEKLNKQKISGAAISEEEKEKNEQLTSALNANLTEQLNIKINESLDALVQESNAKIAAELEAANARRVEEALQQGQTDSMGADADEDEIDLTQGKIDAATDN